MLEIFAQLAASLVPKLLVESLEVWSSRKEIKNLRVLARERLARELYLNLEILQEIQRSKGDKADKVATVLAPILTTEAFDRLVDTGLPLSILFEDRLPENIWEAVKLNKQEQKYVGNLTTSILLLERTYHRIKIYKLKVSVGIERSKLDYLSKLIRGSILILAFTSKAK